MSNVDDTGADSLKPMSGPVRPAPNLNPTYGPLQSGVGYSPDGSRSAGTGPRGYGGEQSMGFYWGERGYFLVEGPSGAGGHAANAAGFDGVAYNTATGHLVIYDNKAFADSGNVYSATAINENFAKNLDKLIGRVQTMSDMPHQPQILAKLTAARAALGGSGSWPENVQVAVSNASGQSTGVGGKLANGRISFINYYAAPSLKPAPAGPKISTNASVGSAWQGPGGTVGFEPSRVHGAAMALQELMALAEKWSMIAAASEAWDEFKDREQEVMDIQNANPAYHTWISFTFTFSLGNGEQPKIYHYLPSMEIKSGGSPPKRLGAPREFAHNLLLPALKVNGASSKDTAPAANLPAWLSGYTSVKAALQGDQTGWGTESPARAHQILNGSPMYDILKIVKKLYREDYKMFRLLENTMWNQYNMNNCWNAAAIVAVRMSDNSNGNKFNDYQASCKEYGLLPDEQKKDIQDFLLGAVAGNSGDEEEKTASTVPKWLVGWWTVWDGNYYYYNFTNQFTVTWVWDKPSGRQAPAPKRPENKGKVIVSSTGVKIVWNPTGSSSSTVETYTRRDGTSETEMSGVSNKFTPLTAKRMG